MLDFLESTQFNTDIVKSNINNNIINIEILDEITFLEYSDVLEMYDTNNIIKKIPIRRYISYGNSFLNTKLKRQNLIIFSLNNIMYSIIKSDKEIKISEEILENNHYKEIEVRIINEEDFSITEYIHDLNHSTKVIKNFPIKNNILNDFALEKDEAINCYETFLKNLENITGIDNLNIEYFYNLIKDNIKNKELR